MKRKLIKQGKDTLTISLPKKWTDEKFLRPGDYVNVEDSGNYLSISLKEHGGKKEGEFDITHTNDKRFIRVLMSQLYKKGYDIVRISYKDPSSLKEIERSLRELYNGFAITSNSGKRVTISSFSKEDFNEYESIQRRAFLVTLSLAESISEKLDSGDYSMEELYNMETTNNQLTNFCERIIVKGNTSFKSDICFKYIIIWNLEKICDKYKDIAEFLNSSEKRIGKDIISMFKEANILFRKYYETVFRFSYQNMEQCTIMKKSVVKKIEKSKPKHSTEYKMIHLISELVEDIGHFTGPVTGLNL